MLKTLYRNLTRYVNRKYYTEIFHQPKLLLNFFRLSSKPYIAKLPWGPTILINPSEHQGYRIKTLGVYDLCVCEAIWKLMDSGEYAIDAGANIGQMTSVMATKVGKNGKVFSIEPHPRVYEELLRNVRNWDRNNDCARIYPMNLALSNKIANGTLVEPADHEQNYGEAFITEDKKYVKSVENTYTIKMTRLDEIIRDIDKIGLLKIDVEGHEAKVLKGATESLKKKKFRDIIFEEHGNHSYPTVITDYLESYGYTVFYMVKHFLGIAFGDLKKNREIYKDYTYYNCLASIDSNRAEHRMRRRGWEILKQKNNIF